MAAPAAVSCGTAINEYYSGQGDYLIGVGTRVTTLASFGHHSFTMASGFQIATMPINTPAAAQNATFQANKGDEHYRGTFTEVFLDRGNNDVERWEFWVSRTGEVWLRSITYNGYWIPLQGVTCFRGPGGQTVIRGTLDHAHGGSSFWTFNVAGRKTT